MKKQPIERIAPSCCRTLAVLAAALVAATAPSPSFAATIVTQTINNVEWRFKLDSSAGTATIGLGENAEASYAYASDIVLDADTIPWTFTGDDNVEYTVTAIAAEAFRGKTNMTGKITIPITVKSIGVHAFSGKCGITGIAGCNGVTTWESYVFNCPNLTGTYPDLSPAVSLGESVFGTAALTGPLKLGSSLAEIPRCAFYQYNITGTAVVPSTVTKINDFSGKGVFGECPNLEAIWVKGKPAASSQTYTTIAMKSFAQKSTNVKIILMGQNTKGSSMASSNYMLANDSGVQVFVPANGYWNGLVTGGTNNKVWYYGPTNDFNLVVDDDAMRATFTPTTAESFTNALAWASLFKEHFDLEPRINVTNAIDLADVEISEDMVADATFDRLMFAVKTQSELDNILGEFPSDTPLAIDPSEITENLTIPVSRKVYVLLSEADAVKLKAKGFAIIFR